jgi:fluoride ion exporter CrcB/FEX
MPLDHTLQQHPDVGTVLARHQTIDDANTLASIDRPPSEVEELPPVKIYHPLSIHVLALLMPASIFGVLARLGLQALATYNGESIFPLAYVQATGCFIMGVGLRMKVPFGNFYGPLYTAMTTGFCGSLTTFSGWQVDVFDSWVNSGQFYRGGLRDVSRPLSFCGPNHDAAFRLRLTVHRRFYKDLGHSRVVAGVIKLWSICLWSSSAVHSSPSTAKQNCSIHAYHSCDPHIRSDPSSVLLSATQFPPPSDRCSPIFLPWHINTLSSVHKFESPLEDYASWNFYGELTRDRPPRFFPCTPRFPVCSFPRYLLVASGFRRRVLRLSNDNQHICCGDWHIARV